MKTSTLLGAAVASALVLSGCGKGTDTASEDGGTVKIGVVLPYTGVQATIARMEGLGVETAAEEINKAGGIAGKWKIELVKQDDKLSIERSATVMRDLKAEGVQMALGGQTTDLCQSAAEAADRFGIMFVGAHCTSRKLVEPEPVTPNFFMTGQLDSDMTKANGTALAKEFPNVKTWDVFAYDQKVTRNFWTQTSEAISEQTGEPVRTNKEIYVPVDATDLRDQLSTLTSGHKGKKSERGLFLGVYGAGTTSFIQQARPLGLSDDYAVTAQTGVYWSTAKSYKGKAPAIYDVHEYFWNCQKNAANDTFVKNFEKLAKEKPDTGAYQGYVALKMIAAAIEKAGTADRGAVQKAMAGLSVDTPAGRPLTMDGTTHHAKGPITTATLYGDPSAPETVGVKDCKIVQASDL
jgi:branched-chain amino acid transport system substrate-binding protein